MEHLESMQEQRCTAVASPTHKRLPMCLPPPRIDIWPDSSNRPPVCNWTPHVSMIKNKCAAFIHSATPSISCISTNAYNLAGCQREKAQAWGSLEICLISLLNHYLPCCHLSVFGCFFFFITRCSTACFLLKLSVTISNGCAVKTE